MTRADILAEIDAAIAAKDEPAEALAYRREQIVDAGDDEEAARRYAMLISVRGPLPVEPESDGDAQAEEPAAP